MVVHVLAQAAPRLERERLAGLDRVLDLMAEPLEALIAPPRSNWVIWAAAGGRR